MGKCVSIQDDEMVQDNPNINTETKPPSLAQQTFSDGIPDAEMHNTCSDEHPHVNVDNMHKKLKKMTSVEFLPTPLPEVTTDDKSTFSETNDIKYNDNDNDSECIKRFVFVSLNQLYEQLNSGCPISEEILSTCIICTNCSKKEFYKLYENEKEKEKKSKNTNSVLFYHTFLSFIALKDTHNLVFWLQHNNLERSNNWRRINKKLLYLGYNKINLHKSYWRKNYQNLQDFDDGWHFTEDGLEELKDGDCELYQEHTPLPRSDCYHEYSIDQFTPPQSISTTKVSIGSYSDIKIDANCNIKILPSKEQLMVSKYGSDIDSILHLLKSPMDEYYRPLMEIMYQSNPKHFIPVIQYCNTVQYD